MNKGKENSPWSHGAHLGVFRAGVSEAVSAHQGREGTKTGPRAEVWEVALVGSKETDRRTKEGQRPGSREWKSLEDFG